MLPSWDSLYIVPLYCLVYIEQVVDQDQFFLLEPPQPRFYMSSLSLTVLALLLMGCFITLISGVGGGGLNVSTFLRLLKKRIDGHLDNTLRHP